MKKFLTFAAFIAALALAACDEEEPEPIPEPSPVHHPFYAYVLGEGNWQKNDASMAGLYVDDLSAEKNLYYKANNQLVGDTGNDLVYAENNCLYMAVSGSEYVAKLDLYGKELLRFSTLNNEKLTQPRSLIADGEYIYVSTYGKHVARLDTATLSLQGMVEVGTYSEEMAIIDNHLAVCNSGWGHDYTVSIIDTKTFTLEKTIELPKFNPQNIIAQGDCFYVNTAEYDEFYNTFNSICEINTKTWEVKVVSETGFYLAPLADGNVLIVSSATDWSTYTTVNTFETYNPKTGKTSAYELKNELAKELQSASVYGFDLDPTTGYLWVLVSRQDESYQYIGSSLYVLNGGEAINKIEDTGCANASSIAYAK